MTDNKRPEEITMFSEEPIILDAGKVKAVMGKHLEIKDWQAVDIILATAASHYYAGEPIWLRFIGASRSGKTELLRALSDHSDTEKMEVLTPAALRGGYKGGGLKDKKKLLERLNGKLVITKETSQIITTRNDARNEVFGLLRGIKDGELVSDFGSEEGHLEQKTSFDWILGATTIIEQQRMMDSLLGARFIDLHWYSGDRELTAIKAMENNPNLPIVREDIKNAVHGFLNAVKVNAKLPIELDEGLDKWIAHVANITSVLRTGVQKDSQHHIITIPEPEFPTELAQGFSRIVKGLRLLELDRKSHLMRLAIDCIPTIRVRILKAILLGKFSPTDISAFVRLPIATVEYHLADMVALDTLAKINTGYYIKIDLTTIQDAISNMQYP